MAHTWRYCRLDSLSLYLVSPNQAFISSSSLIPIVIRIWDEYVFSLCVCRETDSRFFRGSSFRYQSVSSDICIFIDMVIDSTEAGFKSKHSQEQQKLRFVISPTKKKLSMFTSFFAVAFLL